MNSKDKALINYYARLVNKENYKMEDVPEHLQSQVKGAIEKLKLGIAEYNQIDKDNDPLLVQELKEKVNAEGLKPESPLGITEEVYEELKANQLKLTDG